MEQLAEYLTGIEHLLILTAPLLLELGDVKLQCMILCLFDLHQIESKSRQLGLVSGAMAKTSCLSFSHCSLCFDTRVSVDSICLILSVVIYLCLHPVY